MSIYGSMRTSVSGMNAQSNRLATIADNIANGSTVGYKRSETQFASLVHERSGEVSRYESGGVTTRVRQRVTAEGNLQFTTSATDLAIQGNGFFLVESPSGERVLTRAGSFVPNGEGRLVNTAGFALLGQPAGTNSGNGGELAPIDLASEALSIETTTRARLVVNLDEGAPVPAPADRPSANGAGATPTATTSLMVFGAQGEERLLDFHYTRTGADQYELAVFDRSAAAVPGPFPYASGPLATQTLDFDAVEGTLLPTSAQGIDVPVPGSGIVAVDLSLTTQLAAEFSVREINADGYGPSAITRVEITRDGALRAVNERGDAIALFEVPVATVTAPDRLAALPGNVYAETQYSGRIVIGRAETGSAGSILSGALEASNVDIATELTDMIESQRSFTANSKVFQTGSELMDVIVNLKR